MKTAILAIEGATSFSVLGSYDMLTKINKVGDQESTYFEPQLIGVKDKVVKSSSGHPFICEGTVQENNRFEIIILPSCDGDIFNTIETNNELLPWLIRQYEEGAILTSVCTGAFLLAATGLMDGKKITTHWAYFQLMNQRFPDVLIETSKNIVDHDRLICAGGGTSFMHLVMYLISKFYGHDVASLCSKYMLVDMEKIPQSTYSVFMPFKRHGNDQILMAQEIMESRYQDKLTITSLALEVGLSERTFSRKFKKYTTKSVVEYFHLVRVEAAKKLLEDQEETVQRIMYQVGYTDMANFRRIFTRLTGLTFTEYRKKFNIMVPY